MKLPGSSKSLPQKKQGHVGYKELYLEANIWNYQLDLYTGF